MTIDPAECTIMDNVGVVLTVKWPAKGYITIKTRGGHSCQLTQTQMSRVSEWMRDTEDRRSRLISALA